MVGKKRRRKNPAELILVNPGTPSKPVYRKKKSSAGAGSRKKATAKKKTAAKKKTSATRKPGSKMAIRTRRRVAKKTTARRKNPKRVAAGKKAARTRKRLRNPIGISEARWSKMSTAEKKAWYKDKGRVKKKRAAAKKTSAGLHKTGEKARRSAAAKKAWAKRKRKKSTTRKKASATRKRSTRAASTRKRATKRASSTRRRTASRSSVSRKRSLAAKKGWRTRMRKGAAPKRKARRMKNYRKLTKSGQRRSRGVRTLKRARRSIMHQRRHGRTAAQKYLRRHGMTKINPSFKMLRQDLMGLLPTVGVGLGAMVGGFYLGKMVNEQVVTKWVNAPQFVKDNSAPISTGIATVLMWAASKVLFKGKYSRMSVPILIGGAAATFAHVILARPAWAAKLGMVPGKTPVAKQVAATKAAEVDVKVGAAGPETLQGLGDYAGSGGVFGEYTAMGNYVPPGGARYMPDGVIGEYTAMGEYTSLGTGNTYFGADDATQWAPGQSIPGFGDYAGSGGVFGDYAGSGGVFSGLDDDTQYSNYYQDHQPGVSGLDDQPQWSHYYEDAGVLSGGVF